jgi:Mn-containing catalase
LGGGAIQLQSSEVGTSETLQELLVDQLRDLLHAEKQLLKALPKMAQSARSTELKRLFEVHLEETERQAERIE